MSTTPWRNRRLSRAGVFNAPARQSIRRILHARWPKDGPLARCATCGEPVGVHEDATLYAHRVGKSRADSWMCPGGGTTAPPED
jgi:hypothetical protein